MIRVTRLFKTLAAKLGVDRAVAYVLLAKCWSVGAGMVTLVLITTRLTLAEQGTYYTFANILGLQIFLELGLGFVVMQVASHEVAHLKVGDDGVLTGDAASKARLGSLLQSTVKIYAMIAGAFLLLILPIGFWFFMHNAPAGVSWSGPWFFLVLSASCAILFNPLMAFLEGCGRIAEVEGRRLSYAVSGNILCWLLLICGMGLYCTLAIYTVMAVGGGIWFWRRHRHWLADLWRSTDRKELIEWKTEVWPFQWRIAVSWLSGYFIFQLFNPLLYAYAGAGEAGKMGLTLQIANLFGGMAFGWLNTKVPLLGKHVARKEWDELDGVFRSVLVKSSLVLVAALVFSGMFLGALPHLPGMPSWIQPLIDKMLAVRGRMLSIGGIGAMFLCVFSQHIIGALAVYMRAHKREPMLGVSLLMGVLVGGGAYFSARTGKAENVVYTWCALQWAVALPLSGLLFKKLQKQWHA